MKSIKLQDSFYKSHQNKDRTQQLKEKPKSIKEKQAAAAVGQCELMHIYSKFFGEYSHIVGQVLLTRDVVEDDHIRENVVNTFETLLENKIIVLR